MIESFAGPGVAWLFRFVVKGKERPSYVLKCRKAGPNLTIVDIVPAPATYRSTYRRSMPASRLPSACGRRATMKTLLATATALLLALATSIAFAQTPPADAPKATDAAKAETAKKPAPKKAAAKKDEKAPAKKTADKKAAPPKQPPKEASKQATRTYSTGPTVLRDKDGNIIPTNPEAYNVDSALPKKK